MSTFRINGVTLELLHPGGELDALAIRSVPRPYDVTFRHGEGAGERLRDALHRTPGVLLLVDRFVYEQHLAAGAGLEAVPTYVVDATEQHKQIHTALEIVEFLDDHQVSRASRLFVVGGGIVQDLGAFAAYLYKRGIPWVFVPTTLLAQGDSCVGGKTALNHRETKNLLALFSAPREIVIDADFLSTLSTSDWLSGCGEILRLCVTGGEPSLQVLEAHIDDLVRRSPEATTQLVRTALAVKKAVVEHDEFELDLRRSMNYGHSIGHALEALTHFRLLHGTGVAIGIAVENELSFRRGMLPMGERDRILALIARLISDEAWQVCGATSLDGVLGYLRRDKKVEGAVLKLATLERIGSIAFVDLTLDTVGEAELQAAFTSALEALSALRRG